MRKVLSCILCAAVLCLILRTPVSADADEPLLSARAYVLYCVNSGEFLLGSRADERLPMASTTKIMTALLTLEAAARENRTVTFTDEMTAEGSSMYLQIGEQVTLYDLAVGMLMQSGNDAANAAAVAIGGSPEDFADLMNRRAASLGMNDTHFVTPSGLDAEGHCTTAFDMALLMKEAMQNEDFAAITGSTSMTVTFTQPSDKTVTYPNHNKLLTLYDGCIGGKTGYTDLAGRCLVSCAEREGLRLIAVTLDDGDDWNDHITLYDYGFGHYFAARLPAAEYRADVAGGESDSVAVTAEPVNDVVLPREDDAALQTNVYMPAFLYAPVGRGEEVGKIIYTYRGDIVAEAPLCAEEEVAYNSRPRGIIAYIKDLFNWHSQ